jgi:hypothetical protein
VQFQLTTYSIQATAWQSQQLYYVRLVQFLSQYPAQFPVQYRVLVKLKNWVIFLFQFLTFQTPVEYLSLNSD